MKVFCPKCNWFVEGDHLEARAMNKAWGEHYLRDHSQLELPVWFRMEAAK